MDVIIVLSSAIARWITKSLYGRPGTKNASQFWMTHGNVSNRRVLKHILLVNQGSIQDEDHACNPLILFLLTSFITYSTSGTCSFDHLLPVCLLLFRLTWSLHSDNVIMGAIASQITSLTIVYSTVYSGADQRKYQISASPAFVRGLHRDRWIPHTNGQ